MKRFLCVLLACLMITPAFAESVDLSSLSFDELRTLQSRISQELITRPEWKNVSVPPGLYKVGVDIPAGDWCLKCGNTSVGYVYLRYGKNINESGTEVGSPKEWYGYIHKDQDGSSLTALNIKMMDGYYLDVSSGEVVFTIPEKVDLGF